MVEIERLHEEARIPDLPPAAAAHEAPKLLLSGASLPRRLLLEGAERSKVTVSVDDLFDDGSAERANQLVLQIFDANVEPQSFHVGAIEVGPESGALETTLELALLLDIAEAGKPNIEPLGPIEIQEAPNGLRTADRHDGNALVDEVTTAALGERFERELVADPLDEHDRTRGCSSFDHGPMLDAA